MVTETIAAPPPHSFRERYIGTSPILVKKCSVVEMDPMRKTELNKLYFNDYVFNSHIPTDLLQKLGIEQPKNDQEYDTVLKKICADPRVTKFVNIHGWSAGKEIWEVDDPTQGIPSWTDRQLTTDVTNTGDGKEILGSIVLNFDSNGWGESTLTEEGIKMLPDYFDYLFSLHHRSKKVKKHPRRPDHSVYMSKMPGSVSHAAQALQSTLDASLAMRGVVMMTGHSQGGQITRKYLSLDRNSSFENKNDTTVLGYCVEAADMGRDLDTVPDYDLNTYGLTDKLFLAVGINPQKIENTASVGKLTSVMSKLKNMMVDMTQAMKPEVVRGLSIGTTKMAAMNDLPPELAKVCDEIAELHGTQIESKQLLTLVQAFAWQEFVTEMPEVLATQMRGSVDNLTPNEPFEQWYNSFSVKLDQLPTAYLFSLNELPPPEYQAGPHYAHLNPQNAERIVVAEGKQIKGVIHSLPVIDTAMELINKRYRVRFAQVPDSSEIPSFHARIMEADRILELLHGKELPYPVVIPITTDEMRALYKPLSRIVQDRDQRTALVDKIQFGLGYADSRPKKTVNSPSYSSFVTLAETFPYYLYRNQPREAVRNALVEWIDFDHRLKKANNYSSPYGYATYPGHGEHEMKHEQKGEPSEKQRWEKLVDICMKHFEEGQKVYNEVQ